MDDVYELFRRGTELLEAGHHHQAAVPLSRARDLAPDKTSIREALGRALFGAQRYEQAAAEFEAVAAQAPTNDFALFCLGRSLQMLGRHAEARKPLPVLLRRGLRLWREQPSVVRRCLDAGMRRTTPDLAAAELAEITPVARSAA